MHAPSGQLPNSLRAAVERCYEQFGVYGCPQDLWICPECGPEWSAEDICSSPLRLVSEAQLEAVHATSLDDDGLRYFFPRLVEVLLLEEALSVEFSLSLLKGRLTGWTSTELTVVQQLLDAISHALLETSPSPLGYLSDYSSVLEFADWCDLPLQPLLDGLRASDTLAAARHLADLVSHVLTTAEPFAPAIKAAVLTWLSQAVIGERLEKGFFVADSEQAANQLADAHQLWTICVPK